MAINIYRILSCNLACFDWGVRMKVTYEEIKPLLDKGYTFQMCAEYFNTSRGAISGAVYRAKNPHVKYESNAERLKRRLVTFYADGDDLKQIMHDMAEKNNTSFSNAICSLIRRGLSQ